MSLRLCFGNTRPSTWLCLVAAFAILGAPLSFAQGGGSISGTVLENIENVYGIDIALEDGDGVLVELVSEDGDVTSTTSQNGSYSFTNLAPGEYQLIAYDRDSRTATADVSVASNLETTANVVLISRKAEGVFVYSPAIGVESGVDMNPDVNVDGIVNSADLVAVRQANGTEAFKSRLDVNRDNLVDDADVALVEAAFGKVIVNIGTKYQAQVTPGGSIAMIGEGLASVRSESGSTTGLVSWAPNVIAVPTEPTEPAEIRPNFSADKPLALPKPMPKPGSKSAVRYKITEDTGVASSPIIGEFNFDETPSNLTWIDVDLETGRVKNGLIGLTLSGGFFSDPVNIEGDVPDGIIAFSADGFALYHVVNVTGTMPDNFPVYAGEAFVMGKCDPPKANVKCLTKRAKATDTCSWPAPFGGTGTCTGVGSICSTENAACASGGACKTCQTQCTRTLGGVLCGCWCLP